MSLDIKVEAEKLRDMYKQRQSEQLICALVLGDSGSGKTKLLETCRRPIHIDSFDPKGTETIRKAISEGWVIPDIRYEKEDPTDPTAFELWDSEFERRQKEGYFNQIGTYALDSFTMFMGSIMNLVLKGLVRKADRGGKTGSASKINTEYLQIPQENDWPLAMNIIMNVLKDLTNLPCDVVLTGHIEDKTRRTKSGEVHMGRGIASIGKQMFAIPRLFEEIYVLKPEEKSGGLAYYLFTGLVDGVAARTRIGRDIFDYREVPDVMALLKKAGLNPQHKPMSWLEK